MRATATTLMLCVAGALAAPAAAQKRPAEEAAMRQMAAGDPRSWEAGVVASLGVAAADRSPELLTAMIGALEHSVRWHAGDGNGPIETGGHLAQALAATRDPRVLPALAWYAYNGPPATVIMVDFGHQAVPHLLAVAMSPDAPGDHARAALRVLAGIAVRHGPGEYGPELAEAAKLHLDGPPDHYYSRWSNLHSISPLLEAIALAGAIRTPDLLDRLKVIAASTPARIEEMTGIPSLARRAPGCARAVLDRTEPPTGLCDPAWWATYPERVRRR